MNENILFYLKKKEASKRDNAMRGNRPKCSMSLLLLHTHARMHTAQPSTETIKSHPNSWLDKRRDPRKWRRVGRNRLN